MNTEHSQGKVRSNVTDSKWWGESGELRMQLTGHVQYHNSRQDISVPHGTEPKMQIMKVTCTSA
jgi:hypothetical protein